MRIETIQLHELPQDGMPDAEETLLLSTAEAGVDTGFYDGEHWRWCWSGDVVAEPVLGWAKVPEGLTMVDQNAKASTERGAWTCSICGFRGF